MGTISVRFDAASEDELRRAAANAGQSVSAFVRSAVRSSIDRATTCTLLERLGDVVGRFDSAAATTHPDELGDYLQAEHERQATASRALRRARDTRRN